MGTPTPIQPVNFTLTSEQYTALVAMARKGVNRHSQVDQQTLEQFLISIEKANGVTRYLLWVQWQELDAPVPATAKFPTEWPPNLRQLIQQINTPISYQRVLDTLATYAKNPQAILVTTDPGAVLGWTDVKTYFNISP